jgi:CheY-like chemotaxis protein
MASARVLVADDHAGTRALIASLLKSEFDVVATVADGQAAVDATRALHPDVVVLDIAMPMLNGFEAAAIIRDLPDAPRIVFCTAYDDAEFVKAAFAHGATALVLKRVMLVELVPAVRRALKFHGVYFYEDAPSLSHTVASFIGEGLVTDQPAVLIATASHSAAIREQLTAMGVDAEGRIEQGELLMLDADEVLHCFMVDELPNAGRFKETMTPIIDRAAGSRKRMVRAYGEMVDVLWRNNREAAAVSLEILWNQLIARRKCSLLCGYSLDAIGKGGGYNRICDQHSHVHLEDRI